MTAVAEAAPIAAGWLRSREFDLHFIFAIAALALISGWVVVADPRLFVPILLADLWLLGYHHVIATYTRLCFDRESFRQHRFLVLGLPPLVIGGVLVLGLGVGLWVLASIYLYWQWFHYTRQSFGIAQAYRRKSNGLVDDPEWLGKLIFYAVPLWGIVHRSAQDPGSFLGLELRVIPVPALLDEVLGLAAAAAVCWWVAGRVLSYRRGRLAVAHTAYMASHFVVFYVGYLLIEDITYGWLVINVWHNAQYIAFVWLYNNNRFKGGIDARAKFLSTISQSRFSWLYFAVCLGISSVLYLALENMVAALPLLVVTYQAINFHHYIVDGLIWKMRRRPLQKVLGLNR
ncbi:MAG: hypothetical protein ACE5JZ_02760 [Kiloniellales bacterium]